MTCISIGKNADVSIVENAVGVHALYVQNDESAIAA